MRLEVVYEDGVWSFTVSSLDPTGEYLETFELTELSEAQDTAWDLMEELTRTMDEDFNDLFDGLPEDDR